jgi:hypothetical protein
MDFCIKSLIAFLLLSTYLFPYKCYPADPEDIIASQLNYAYANYLGTGFYTAADRTVLMFHLPLRYTLREVSQGKAGLRLRLPLTIGVTKFDYFDPNYPALPDKFETFTFVPGIQYIYQVNNQWSLSPFIDFGIGHDFETKNNAYIYGAGINSLLIFKYEAFNLEIYNEFLFAGNTTELDDVRNEFSRFQTGINFQFPINFKAWGRDSAISTYYLNYIYFNELEFLRYLDESIKVSVQNEIGITFDTSPDMKLLGIPFSRVGLGYRFGNEVDVVRLVFGIPF